MSLLGELSRRNVYRVAIAYVIATWVVIQVADLVLENIGAPDWVIKAMMLVMALGFPVALIFSWAYEVTPEGIRRESEIDRTRSITGVTGHKLDRVIIVLLVVALAYFVWESRITDESATSDATVAAESAAIDTPAAKASRLSIAVLPFVNRSKREEDEFFTTGIHDDLLTTIAKIGSMKVISRTSVMEYKDTTKKIPQIARELGVANILEGGIQRAGNQVRINVQLIDAVTDEHLWAEIYDRELTAENIFAIQSEISKAIAEALQATLSPDEHRRIDTAPTDNLDAYDAYLRGRLLMATREAAKLEESIDQYHRAVEIDPQFALAWVGLADALNLLQVYGTLSLADSLPEREAAIDKALAINPDLGEAYASLGGLHRDRNRPEDAERAYRKAIELSPNYATGYHWLSLDLGRDTLRAEESLILAKQAADIDPRSLIIGTNLAGNYFGLGEFAAAEREIKRVLQIDPGFAQIHTLLSGLYWQSGQLGEAIGETQTAFELDPGRPSGHIYLSLGYWALGAKKAAISAYDSMRERFPDDDLTHLTTLLLAVVKGSETEIREAIEPLLKSDDSYISFEVAHAYLVLGEYEMARDSFLNSNSGHDYMNPELWPQFVREYDVQACVFAWSLIQAGGEEQGQALLQEALHHFDDLLPRVVLHVDSYSPDICYLAAGDNEKALASIEQQFEHGHFGGFTFDHTLPLYDLIWEHPRYVAVREKIEVKLAEQRAIAGL